LSFSQVLDSRRILLGITGGIALYKACELIRLLKKENAQIRVILSTGAEEFVKPTLFSALTGEKTYTNQDFFVATGSIPHIELANWAELVLIFPATASFLSKLRTGQASELLLTTLLATRAPTYLFPSMNTKMWEHPATKENIEVLRRYGYLVYEPAYGELACGEIGKGRVPEPAEILELITAHFKPKDMKGKKVLITGGPTREYIDEVRFLTNASSGKTAFYLLKEAYYRGAEVHLLWGLKDFPYVLPKLNYVSDIPYPKIYFIETTEEMFQKAKELFPQVDVAIFAAAPCDFTPLYPAKGKIKKGEPLTLEFKLTPDIAKTLGQTKGKQLCIGFALEEGDKLSDYAQKKRVEKNFDIIIANPLGTAGKERSKYLLIGPNFEKIFEDMSKEALAVTVFDLIASLS